MAKKIEPASNLPTTSEKNRLNLRRRYVLLRCCIVLDVCNPKKVAPFDEKKYFF